MCCTLGSLFPIGFVVLLTTPHVRAREWRAIPSAHLTTTQLLAIKEVGVPSWGHLGSILQSMDTISGRADVARVLWRRGGAAGDRRALPSCCEIYIQGWVELSDSLLISTDQRTPSPHT